MASQGPLYTGTGANFADGGNTAWTNPTNVQGDTTSTAATCSPGTAIGHTSQRLRCSNFGFTLDAAASVLGITVEVEQQGSSNNRSKWNSIQLLIGGSESGNNLSDGSVLFGKTIKTFGSTSELWGLTPTATQVNNSGFGVSLKVERTATTAITDSFFRVRITVEYSVAAVYTPTGFASAVGFGAGDRARELTRSGLALIGLVGSGASELPGPAGNTYIETGAGIIG